MPSKPEAIDRAAVGVAEMARLCGVSRSHFWSLVRKGTMPPPIYAVKTRRPLYDAELQQVCLRIRQSNVGFDGEYVMFYRVSPRANPAARQGAGRGRSP